MSMASSPAWRGRYRLYPAPEVHNSSERYDGPRLIVFCAWTDATAKNIKKYVDGYQRLYPSTPIIVVETYSADFFTAITGSLTRAIEHVVEMIQQELQDGSGSLNSRGEGLLVHALSNGGSGHMAGIARHYHSKTGKPFPVDALILDSTPTRPTFGPLLKSISMSLPRPFWLRRPLQVFVSICLFIAFILPRWFGKPNVGDSTCNDLCSPGPFRKDAIRTYIYSTADVLCPSEGIESNYRTAKERGFRVRYEKFEESGHVAHMKHDPERYWRAVEDTWTQRV